MSCIFSSVLNLKLAAHCADNVTFSSCWDRCFAIHTNFEFIESFLWLVGVNQNQFFDVAKTIRERALAKVLAGERNNVRDLRDVG